MLETGKSAERDHDDGLLQPKLVIRAGAPVIEMASRPATVQHKQDQDNLQRRLMLFGSELQQRKAQAKEFKDLYELKEFRFRPQINQESINIVNKKKRQLQETQQLEGIQ